MVYSTRFRLWACQRESRFGDAVSLPQVAAMVEEDKLRSFGAWLTPD